MNVSEVLIKGLRIGGSWTWRCRIQTQYRQHYLGISSRSMPQGAG